MMKKRLKIFLFVTAVLFSIGISSVNAQSNEAYAPKVLDDIGITASLYDQNNLTRAEFIGIIMDFIGYYNTSATSVFNDVSEKTNYCSQINAAYEMGLISGSGALFFPERNITYAEAVVVLVRLTGYTYFAEASGGYPIGYVSAANTAGILKGTGINDIFLNAQRETLALLLLNALEADIVGQTSSGSDLQYGINEDCNLLYKYKKIRKSSGIVTANKCTGLYDDESTGPDYVKIGDNEYFENNSGISDFLGYNVKFYYTDGNTDDMNIKAFYTNENNNDINIIDADEIEKVSGDSIEFIRNNNRKRLKISPKTAVIYNGKSEPFYTGKMLIPQLGEIKTIDNNRDGYIDVISVESYTNCVVYNIDKYNMIISDRYSENNSINLSDEGGKYVTVLNEKHMPVGIDEISVGNVLTVMQSTDKKIVKALLSTHSIRGTVTEKYGNDDELFVTVSDVEYKVCPSIASDKSCFGVNDTGVFYLNSFNQIAAWDKENFYYDYAFLIKAVQSDDMSDGIDMRYLGTDGEVHIASVNKSFKLNGTRTKTVRGVPQELKSRGIIMLRTDKDGNITAIDTEDKIVKNAENEKQIYCRGIKSFGGKVVVNDGTVYFYCPANDADSDAESYGIMNEADFTDGGTYRIDACNSDTTSPVSEAVAVYMSDDDEIVRAGDAVVIDEIKSVLKGDDETVSCQIGYYTLDSHHFSVLKSMEVLPQGGLQRGDIIKFNIDMNNEICKIDRVFSAEKMCLESESSFAADKGVRSSFRAIYGNVYLKKDDVISVYSGNDIASATRQNLNFYAIQDVEQSYVYAVDKKSVYPTDVSRIYDYVHSSIPSNIVVCTRYANIRLIVIYE